MNDSRFSARKYLRAHWPITRKLILFVGVIIMSWIFNQWIVSNNQLGETASNALFLVFLAAGLWIAEAIPPFAVSLLVIGFAIYFVDDTRANVISDDWEKYANTLSSPVIWIFLSGFFLAIGARITQFDQKFSKYMIRRFGVKPYPFLLGIMLSTGILSMFMSNTATVAMMIATITPLASKIDKKDPFILSLFLGLATAGTVGGMGTIIGSPPNAIAIGAINNQQVSFGFLSWMILGVPLAMGFIILTWFLLKLKFPTAMETLPISVDADENHTEEVRNTHRNRVIVVITFCITLSLWITSSLHQIPVAVIAFIPIIFFSITGIVLADDLRFIPWDTLILVAGGLTLGLVIKDSGLADFLVQKIPVFQEAWIMLLILGYLTTLISNLMSNTAAASLFIPVGISLLPENILEVALVIGFSASTALLLPISTPPNAIAFSTDYLKQSNFRYLGIIMAAIGPLIILMALQFIN